MIKPETIFVLGAGASMPYGYPSGADLLDALVEDQGGTGSPLINVYPILQNANDDGLRFIKILKHAYPPSIDYFLMQHKDDKPLVDYGKAAIIRYFQGKEYKSTNNGKTIGGVAEFCLPRNKDNDKENNKWYGYFFHNILGGKSFDDLMNNNITVINFNYDRSFECFAYHHIINTYPTTTDKDVFRFFKRINYCHVYGCIAPIYKINDDYKYNFSDEASDIDDIKFVFNDNLQDPWQYGMIQDRHIQEYFKEKERLKIIKVIDEERDANMPTKWSEILKTAKYLCFFGFGYNETNMNVIKLNGLNQHCVVSGTVRDISIPQLQNIAKYFAVRENPQREAFFRMFLDKKRVDTLKYDDIVAYCKFRFVPFIGMRDDII